MIDRFALSAELFCLTFTHAFLLCLTGSIFFSLPYGKKIGGSFLTGFGLLAFYPFAITTVSWLPPTPALMIYLGLLLSMTVFNALKHGLSAYWGLMKMIAYSSLLLSLLAASYWAPGLTGRDAGMFTEASGDFTIYAGVPERLGEQPVWSGKEIQALLHNAWTGLPLWDRGPNPIATEARDNPPYGGWSIGRIIVAEHSFGFSGWYHLQHILFRIPIGGFEERYTALLALVWALAPLTIARFIYLHSKSLPASFIALVICASSQSWVSVGHNHYFPQLVSSAMLLSCSCWLMLPANAQLGIASLGVILGLTALNIFVMYLPILPMLGFPVLLFFVLILTRPKDNLSSIVFLRLGKRSMAAVLLTCVFLLTPMLCAVELVPNLMQYAAFGQANLSGQEAQSSQQLAYFGKPDSLDLNWLGCAFGGYLIHRIAPYYESAPYLSMQYPFLALGAAICLACLTCKCISLVGSMSKSRRLEPVEYTFIFMLAPLVAITAIQLYLGRSFEYTQYKALSYLLPAWLLTFSYSLLLFGHGNNRKHLTAAMRIGVGLYIIGLCGFRVEAHCNIANANNKAAVLDHSINERINDISSQEPENVFLCLASSGSNSSILEYGLRNTWKYFILDQYSSPSFIADYSDNDQKRTWLMFDAENSKSAMENNIEIVALNHLKTNLIHAVSNITHQSTHFFFGQNGAEMRQKLWINQELRFYVFQGDPDSLLRINCMNQNTALVPEIKLIAHFPNSISEHIPIKRLTPMSGTVQLRLQDILGIDHNAKAMLISVEGPEFINLEYADAD